MDHSGFLKERHPTEVFVILIAILMTLMNIEDIFLHDLESSAFWILLALSLYAIIQAIVQGPTRLLSVVILFSMARSIDLFPQTVNHQILGWWILLPAALFPSIIKTEGYRDYLSMTMGLVMLAASAQKLISGNYIDGSYLSDFAVFGSRSEELVGFLCGPGLTPEDMRPCGLMIFASNMSLIWQAAIGFLLVFRIRNTLVFALEIAFLLSVGLVADEMSFQSLTIATMLIVMGVRPSVYNVGFVLTLKAIGFVGVSQILIWVS